MSNKKIYLGVDGGATKTEAAVIDEERKELGRGLAAGSNPDVFGLSESVNRIHAAIEQACAGEHLNISKSCLAIAGIDTNVSKKVFKHALKSHPVINQFISNKPFIVNDSFAALRSGTIEENALVIISGTGSNCLGRNSSGQTAKSGGVDYILSDEGSGYDIGLKILRKVTQSIDGRGPETKLKELLFKKINVNSLEALVSQVYEKPWNKADIARISTLADEAAQKGDKVAKEIIALAAHDLGVMIKAVIKKLNLRNKKFTIVTAGSVFSACDLLMKHLKKDVFKFASKAKFVRPKIDSATAAAYLAMENK